MNMRTFLDKGELLGVSIGMNRENVIGLLGAPVQWVGQPPTIGKAIVSYEDSPVFLYAKSAVGIHFNRQGIANALTVNFDRLKTPQETKLFSDGCNFETVGNLIQWLNARNIPFTKARDDEDPKWMLIRECAVVTSIPFEDGYPIQFGDQHLYSITVTDGHQHAMQLVRTGRYFE